MREGILRALAASRRVQVVAAAGTIDDLRSAIARTRFDVVLADAALAAELHPDGRDLVVHVLEEQVEGRDELVEAVSVAAGQHARWAGRGLGALTARQEEVLALVADGLSNDAIAERLGITRRAVERHVNAIFAKLRLADSKLLNRRVVAALLHAEIARSG